MLAFLDGKIANFKIPTKVAIMSEALPRNAAGKFLKRELQQQVVKGTLKAASDAEDAIWVPFGKIGDYGLWKETRRIIEKSARILAANFP